MRLALLVVFFIVFNCDNSFAFERIAIETKNDNFFENVVSDTLLLMDPYLRKIIAADFAHVVDRSEFNVQVNSWKPRPSPKRVLNDIYNDSNMNNIKESFASLGQPVVELACTQRNDQLNEYQTKCIKELFKYPIIHTIQIRYIYNPKKTIEQNIILLSNLNDGNRYQQIVSTIAEIMNSAFEKAQNIQVVKDVLVVKYPLGMLAVSSDSVKAKEINNGDNWYENKRMEAENLKTEQARRQAGLDAAEADEDTARRARSARNAAARANSGPIVMLPNGQAINTGSGEFLAPTGNGAYFGTQDGTFYTPSGSNGLLNTRTGNVNTIQ